MSRKGFKLNPVFEKLLNIEVTYPYPKRNWLGKRIRTESDKDKIIAAQQKRERKLNRNQKVMNSNG